MYHVFDNTLLVDNKRLWNVMENGSNFNIAISLSDIVRILTYQFPMWQEVKRHTIFMELAANDIHSERDTILKVVRFFMFKIRKSWILLTEMYHDTPYKQKNNPHHQETNQNLSSQTSEGSWRLISRQPLNATIMNLIVTMKENHLIQTCGQFLRLHWGSLWTWGMFY